MRNITFLLSLLLILSLVGCNSTVRPTNQFGTSVSSAVNSEQDISFTDDESIESTDESDESVPEESELVFVGDPIPVLVGHSVGPTSDEYHISKLNEIDSDTTLQRYVDETRVGETKTFNFFGVEFTMPYFQNEYSTRSKYMGIEYGNGNYQVTCDEETGKILKFHLKRTELEKYMNPKTEIVDSDTIKNLCLEYIDILFPSENMDGYTSDIMPWMNDAYIISFDCYANSFKIKSIQFYVDKYGNPYRMYHHDCVPDNIPELTLDDYLYGAVDRIEEYYADKPGVVDIVNYQISDTNQALYHREYNAVGMVYIVSFTVVYSDGSEERMDNYFAYLCDQ